MDKNDPMRPSVWDLSVAGALLTRLPLPHAPQSAFENQARAVWAFPLVGLLIGVIMCLVGAIALALGLETGIAAGLMLVSYGLIGARRVLPTIVMVGAGLAIVFSGLLL